MGGEGGEEQPPNHSLPKNINEKSEPLFFTSMLLFAIRVLGVEIAILFV